MGKNAKMGRGTLVVLGGEGDGELMGVMGMLGKMGQVGLMGLMG